MISRALGHRNLDVTRRYIDMDQEILAEATENIFQLQTATFCGQQGRIFRPVRAILSGQF